VFWDLDTDILKVENYSRIDCQNRKPYWICSSTRTRNMPGQRLTSKSDSKQPGDGKNNGNLAFIGVQPLYFPIGVTRKLDSNTLILELSILIRNSLAAKAFKLVLIPYFPPLPYSLRVNRLPPAQDDPHRPPPSH
jgi:hypothetical protein